MYNFITINIIGRNRPAKPNYKGHILYVTISSFPEMIEIIIIPLNLTAQVVLQYKAMLTLLTAFEANPRGQPAKFNDIRMLDIFKAHQCISFNRQIK